MGTLEDAREASLRELAELLGRHPRLGVGVGQERVELLFEDGRLVSAFTHQRIGSRELEQLKIDCSALLADLSPSARRAG